MKRLLLLVLLAACAEEHEPIRADSTDNHAIQVALLFTKDGCNVYRFHDSGEVRYFVTCPQGRAIAEAIGGERRSCGKNCQKYYESVIPTVAAPAKLSERAP